MGDQPDRRRKPFSSWFSSWSSPSRASQRPRQKPQPQHSLNTSQSPDSHERSSWPVTAENRSVPLHPPPPTQSPTPKATQAEPSRAIDDSHELANGSKTAVGNPEVLLTRSSPSQEDKPSQPYKKMDLESLQNLDAKISHAELLKGEVVGEINVGKTKSVSESKQAETTNVERPLFETVAEVSREDELGAGTETKFLRNEARVEQSIEEETEKGRSPDKTYKTEKVAEEPQIVEEPEGNPNNQVKEHQRKKAEPKMSIAALVSKRNCYHARKEEFKSNSSREPLNDSLTETTRPISTEKERNITISTVARADSSNQDQQGMHMELKEGLSKLVQKLNVGHKNKPGGEEAVSIITLASRNKGASMFICCKGLRGEVPINTHKGKIVDKGTTSEDQYHNERNTNPSSATSINSNVQGINSSILNETSYSERNPGVHMTISTIPLATWSNQGKEESITTQKAASMMASPQKLTYEPRIRRRCLRGLLVEPSEDDMENSEKQRLHGCRFTCDDKKKAKGEGTGS